MGSSRLDHNVSPALTAINISNLHVYVHSREETYQNYFITINIVLGIVRVNYRTMASMYAQANTTCGGSGVQGLRSNSITNHWNRQGQNVRYYPYRIQSSFIDESTSAAQMTDLDRQVVQQNDDHTPNLTEEMWKSFLKPYKSAYEERAMVISDDMIVGNIPKDLKGTLLRNGPGLFDIGGKKIPQPFDGDGKVAMFCFDGNGSNPFFSTRFVRTKAFVEEQRANKMLYRGAFSVGNPTGGFFYNPFDLSVKQVANTGIVRWANKILALYERDLPYHVKDMTLETEGTTTMGGGIDEPYFSAHNCITTEPDGSKRLIAFSASERGLDNRIVIWEFNENGEQIERVETVLKNAAFGFFHDLAVTEKHYIFVENPVKLNMKKFLFEYMFGKACIAECLEFVPSMNTKIHVIPRPGKSDKSDTHREYTCPNPFFTFHHVNAFITGKGHIVLDTCALHSGMDFSANFESTTVSYYDDDVGKGMYTRLYIDTDSGKVTEKKLMYRACDFPCVAPSVTGKPHAHAYIYGSAVNKPDAWGPPQVISKLSFLNGTQESGSPETAQKVYNPGENRWAQEPIFVPREGGAAEDDGWVLVIVYDANTDTSELVILDAISMNVEATIKLPFFMPPGLHGSWTDDYLGPSSLKNASTGDDVKNFSYIYDIRNGV